MTQRTDTKKRGFSLFRYIGEIAAELKKVIWLTRSETAYLTVLVIIVAGTAGILLGALDWGLTALVDKLLSP